MRFGEDIFKQICLFGECEIVYVMDTVNDDAEKDLTESILSILTHFTATASGMKAKRILEICISEENLIKVYTQYKQGFSYVDLSVWCAQQGITGTKSQPLSPSKLHQILTKNQKVLQELVPVGDNIIQEFIKECIKTKSGNIVKQMDIYTVYCEWCKVKEYVPLSVKKMGLALRNAGIGVVKSHGCCKCFKGVEIKVIADCLPKVESSTRGI
jgi:hypothetical protein